MTVSAVLDAAGRRRSPATMPGYHAGRPPRNKGRLYPADPPTVEEIVAVMRTASDDRDGYKLRAMIVVLWRGGLRVAEALTLGERDLDPSRGSLLVRRDPAPARPRQSRHDLDLPARHRHRRDHRHRPRPARTDDVRHRRTPALSNPKPEQRERRPRLTLPLPARAGHRCENECERRGGSPVTRPDTPGTRPRRERGADRRRTRSDR
jgi:integrase